MSGLLATAKPRRIKASHSRRSKVALGQSVQRYYDPMIGRFLSIDPVTAQGGDQRYFNRYWYAAGNPYKFTDPDGRKLEFQAGSTPEFRKQFGQVIAYLKEQKLDGTFKRLQDLPETVIVAEGATISDFNFNPNTDTLTIHPLSGLQVAPGEVQTPALGALHEGSHALRHLTDPNGHKTDRETFDPQYTNKEEKRVIETVETPAAEKLGEPTRTSHGGTPVLVECPTCDN